MKGKIFLSLMVAALLLPAPCAFSKAAPERAMVTFEETLKQKGFAVTPGVGAVYNPLGDFCAGKLPDAVLANSGLYLIPSVPKEAVKPGEVPVLAQKFKIRHDEAIVMIGQTPPPAKYFAFYAHIYSRFYPDKEGGLKKTDIFGTVGDAVNNATIKTAGPTPFNTPFVLILTPDQGTDAAIRAALRHAGYPDAIFNTLVLPASMLNLGHGDTADDFQITLRTARFEDPVAGTRYIEGSPENLHLFRVTPGTPAIAKPFPMPPLRVRGTGESEMRLMNKLAELRAGVIAANPGMYATDFLTAQACYEDYDNLQRKTWADGGTRDAFVLDAGWMVPQSNLNDIITLADDEYLVIYGVNHVATRKSTYMNVNFYATGYIEDDGPHQKWNAFLGGFFEDDLPAGSASGYLPAGDPDANLMYVYKASRNCGKDEAGCVPLSAPCARVTLDANTILGLYFRMYLEPATKVGAATQEILYDRIIKFSPRP